MNLSQIKKILIIATALIVLLFTGVALTILIQNANKKPEEEESYSEKFGNLPNPVSYNLPENLTINFLQDQTDIDTPNLVYQIDKTSSFYPSERLAKKIAQNLRLEESEQSSNLFVNKTSSISLQYVESQNLIQIDFSDTKKSKETIKSETAKDIAEGKLRKLKMWPFEKKYKTKYEYFSSLNLEYVKVDKAKKADYISVLFYQRTKNSQISLKGEIDVLVSKNGGIKKISYNYHPLDSSNTGTYPTITTNEAIQRTTTNQAQLITNYQSIPPRSCTIRNVRIVYRETSPYLQPVYAFEGIDNNGQTVTILVPAIEDEYLK